MFLGWQPEEILLHDITILTNCVYVVSDHPVIFVKSKEGTLGSQARKVYTYFLIQAYLKNYIEKSPFFTKLILTFA